MPGTDAALLTAEEMLALYARRALSPVEVLQAVTERIARLNPTFNAFAMLNPRALEAAGAEVLVLCTNTMHQVADLIEAATAVPFLHIADVTGRAVAAAGLARPGLLGTRYTMERDFYRGRLERAHGLTVLIPDERDRALVHEVIFGELVRGVVSDVSRDRYREVIGRLRERGADGIIAGCTEIELLVGPDDAGLPYFPTTRLHALAAVDVALAAS